MPFSTVFPATRIPNWFKHRRKGHGTRIKASPNWYSNNFLGFAVSAVMHIGDSSSTYFIDDHTRKQFSASILRNGVELTIHSMQTTGSA